MKYSLHDIAALVGGEVISDHDVTLSGLSPIDEITAGSLVFADGADNLKIAEASAAAAILTGTSVDGSVKPLVRVAHPLKAFIALLHHFNPSKRPASGVHPTAVIADDAILGEGVSIGAFVVVGSGSRIGARSVLKSHVHVGDDVIVGEDCVLHPHTTIYDRTHIGSRVVIHASTVIGSDGFGYSFIDGKQVKLPHIGQVVIEDDVEIGANTAVDRATMGATVIGSGTKIDNLVQVAHSVKLGQNNILCAFTGIAGSSKTGKNVVFAANVGVSDHVTIEDGVVLGARTGVPPNRTLKEGHVYLGSPARPKEKAIELELSVNRIPLIRKNIKSLTEQVSEINKKLAQHEAQSE